MIEFLNSLTGVLVSIFSIGAMVVTAYVSGKKRGAALAHRDQRRTHLQARLEKLYAPLRGALLNVHITTVSSTMFPNFGRRWSRFLEASPGVGLRRRVALLSDRGESWGVEVEYGGSFPLERIAKIAEANADIADGELLDLIQSSNRRRYEREEFGERQGMSKAEFELAKHIRKQYDDLRKRFG